MNKILIVGHPLSGYQEVESLLNACGMSAALPSRREGFTPAQISATLCKAHRASPNLLLGSGDAIDQIDAGPIWHGMALDLMLGNLDQEIWGWADPQSIFLLDYWKNLDPNITFILVYDKPHSVLTQAGLNEASTLSAETLTQRSRNWHAYNAALLHFFHRNPARCLLVSSQQVRQSARSYLQQVRARIDAPWPENMERLSAPETVLIDSENENSEVHGIGSDMLDTPLTRAHAAPATGENAIMFYLAEALIQQHPASLQLYDELQSVANLPLTDGETANCTPMDAWQSMAGQQQRLSQAEALNNQQQQLLYRVSLTQADTAQLAEQRRQKNEQLEEQLAAQAQLAAETNTQLSEAKTQAEKRLTELGRHAEQLKVELETAQAAQPVLVQENELLLTQMHQVQEELELYYLEGQQQAQKIQTLQQTEKLATERHQQIEQLTQASAAQARQLAQSRDELAKAVKERTAQVQLDTAQLSAAKSQAEKRAAELVKQAEHLKTEVQVAKAKAKAAAIPLPTANPALEQENELLLNQLHQVQEELERYYLENKALKAPARLKAIAPITVLKLYGAADRVKSELPYRLGATMLAQPRTLTGWLGMPAAVARTQKQFNSEKALDENLNLPSLNQYSDAYKAENVRQHLSYRLGAAFIACSGSPLGWVKLPWSLSHEVKSFRIAKRGLPA